MARRSWVPPCPSNDTVTGRGGLFQAGVAPAGGSGAFGCLHFSALRGSQFLRNSIQTTLGLWCLHIFSSSYHVMGTCWFAFGDCCSTEISDRFVELMFGARALPKSRYTEARCSNSLEHPKCPIRTRSPRRARRRTKVHCVSRQLIMSPFVEASCISTQFACGAGLFPLNDSHKSALWGPSDSSGM